MELDTLIACFRGPLIGLLASWGASARDAQELAQEVFAEAYLARTRFTGDWDDPGATGAWLRGIASKLHLAHQRRGPRRLGERERRELAGEELAPEASAPLEADEERTRVREAIGELRESWRTVLTLYYVEGNALKEVAGLLGISERSAEGRLHRARKELKSLLEKECGVGTSAHMDNEDGSVEDQR